MDRETAKQIASDLYEQHQRKLKFTSHAPPPLVDLKAAYAVQDALVERLQSREGTGVVGYKVGLTSAGMQEMCGLAQPICGAVLADRVFASGVSLRRSHFGRLGLEFEMAMRIGSERMTPRCDFTAASVKPLIDGICAALELVDDRGADYAGLDVRCLVADNAWNAGVVLSAFVAPPDDLRAVCGAARRNGHVIGSGSGADILGDPYASLAWLANHLGTRGVALKPGQIVMTGSMVRTDFPSGEDAYEFELIGIGAVFAHVLP